MHPRRSNRIIRRFPFRRTRETASMLYVRHKTVVSGIKRGLLQAASRCLIR
ncbi:hypothetical protein EIKCOROL_01804 [Eikenella corrodens ATCC 23834]|uniref:Uncharacterized protein n=1 Tax=Eikenella corrodens ATCC 23834 TaxID=546274 RepID=C0DWQ2_EIKCO|nr:hypothetical protein EIKCOROL_01804 [Eikenella corrodens ATCC 23834]